MRVSSRFSARAIERNHHDVPQVLVDGWIKIMHQDPILEANTCRLDEDGRRFLGLSAVVGVAMFALLAVIAGMNTREQFDVYRIFLGVGVLGAIGCFFVAATWLIERSERSRAFDSYVHGFGRNLSNLSEMLGVSFEALRSVNLKTSAMNVLNQKALKFVETERSLKAKLGIRLKRHDWKFDPTWNEDREAFSFCFDVCERFDLVEKVEKKGDAWRPYITWAENLLASGENCGRK